MISLRNHLRNLSCTLSPFRIKRIAENKKLKMSITVGSEYAYVILTSSLISAQCILTGFGIMSLRTKLNVPYPDMGNGRHAAKLSDEDWTTFNNYQRAHYNYVEGIASVLSLELLSGLFHPRFSAAVGVIYMIGRALYTSGYRKSGAKGRGRGALVLDLSLVALFGGAVYGSVNLILNRY